MSAERKTGKHFAKLGKLASLLEESQEREGLRVKTFPNGRELRISRIQSAAQNAYFVSVGNFSCYISQEGLEWVTLPSIEVELGDQKFVLAPPPMEDVKVNKVKAANEIIAWIEECLGNNEIRPLATVDLL